MQKPTALAIQTPLIKSPGHSFSNLQISRTLRNAAILVAATSTLTAFGATRELGNVSDPNRYNQPAPAQALASTPSSTPTGTYAYYVATTGSDANPGTQAAPFRTIKKAASVVIPDTTVHVAPGTYAETITSTVSGTASGRIRYVSDTKWGAKLVPAAGTDTMWRVDGGYTDIDGFQIDGTGGTSVRQGIYMTGGNSSVRNSWIHNVAESSGCDSNGGGGVTVDQHAGAQFDNYDITGNLIHHIGGTCHWIHGIYHASSGTIKNNIVHNTNYGILAGHDPHDLEISNNTVFADNYTGIEYDGGCTERDTGTCPGNNINIFNNIIYDSAGGIGGPSAIEDIGNNSIKNNLIYRSGIYGNFQMGPNALSQVSGTMSADPQFVNYIREGGGDYRLKSSSPAIGKGAIN
ncbi:DUF1565 domain-containing protein [Polaromonas sp. DSR2-3-2]|uniref:DUF1565 domain-containing protein n=1 Tax=unclassified Polaromonas TaxID=2638319 RepID=UPI003CE95FF0